MPLVKMEHYLVLTDDLEATRDFYREVLGLREGFRANLGFPGYWLYLEDTPVIHIAEWKSYSAHSLSQGIPVTTPAEGTGAFDHIAFNGSDPDSMITMLQERGVPFSRNDVAQASLVQLFLFDPNGIKIELNYRQES